MEPDSRPQARRASSQADMEAIYRFLRDNEAMPAVLNPAKALQRIAETIRADLAFMVEIEGQLIATIGLSRADWWFSDEEAFFSLWMHIEEEHRGLRAARALLDEIVDLVSSENTPAWIHWRSPRVSDSVLAQAAEEYALYPNGREMLIRPKKRGESGDVR